MLLNVLATEKETRALYASSQPYNVELAKHLKAKFNWIPIYWFTSSEIEKSIRKLFPSAVQHHYMDAVKGIPPDEMQNQELALLEPELIESLQDKENIALYMMERNDSNSDSFSYRERLSFYYFLLRYWITILEKFEIDVVLFEEEPHQVNDYVLYLVCGIKNVQTMMIVRSISNLGLIPTARFEEGSKPLIREYKHLLETHKNGQKVELMPAIEEYLQKLSGSYDRVLEEHLWDQIDKVKDLQSRSNLFKDVINRLEYLGRKVSNFSLNVERLKYIVFGTYESDQKEVGKSITASQQSYLKMLWYKRQTIARKKHNKEYYASVCTRNLELNRPYIFCALQYQPEKSTCPLAGRFVDQRLMVEMLAKLIPNDWTLLIKEHPSQFVSDYTRYGEQFRSPQFYDDLLAFPNTKLVGLDTDMFKLIDNAEVVASVGGTVCWEAAVRGKTAISFAFAWFIGCEGIHLVKNSAELKEILEIVYSGLKVDSEKVRLFAKAVSSLNVNGVVGGPAQLQNRNITAETNAAEHLKAIELLMMD